MVVISAQPMLQLTSQLPAPTMLRNAVDSSGRPSSYLIDTKNSTGRTALTMRHSHAGSGSPYQLSPLALLLQTGRGIAAVKMRPVHSWAGATGLIAVTHFMPAARSVFGRHRPVLHH